MPAVMTTGGPLDLSTVLFRNHIIFVGQPINSQVAQWVISQLVTLATIDENADILVCLCFLLVIYLFLVPFKLLSSFRTAASVLYRVKANDPSFCCFFN